MHPARQRFLAAIAAAVLTLPVLAEAATLTLRVTPGQNAFGDVLLDNLTDGVFLGPADFLQDTNSTLGDQTTLYAAAEVGYTFVTWVHASGPAIIPPGQLTNDTVDIIADGVDHQIRARFKATPSTVQVSAAIPAQGSVLASNRTDSATDGPASSVALTDVDSGETIELNALPAAGYVFDAWSGDIPPGFENANPAVFTDNSGSDRNITVDFIEEPAAPVTLTIRSTNEFGAIVGDPQPFNGTIVTNGGVSVHFTVTTPWFDPGNTNIRSIVDTYVGTGDIGSGPGGTGDAGTYTINTNSSILWNWHTEYFLTLQVNGEGNVQQTPPGPWYTNGQSVFLQAFQANVDDVFQAWGGDVQGFLPTNTVIMSGPQIVSASFGPLLDSDGDGLPDKWEIRWGLDELLATGIHGAFGDPDNDGLPNILEYNIFLATTNAPFEANPLHADSDGDDMDDGYEYFHIGAFSNALPGEANNSLAVVSTVGVNGPGGNLDQDFIWNPLTGYETTVGLVNIDEYVGPDGVVPATWDPVAVAGLTNLVNRYTANPADSGDLSFSDTTDSEVFAGEIRGDGFDDGYEWSWDVWQSIHEGDPVGDPLGHRVPARFGVDGLPSAAFAADFNGDDVLDLIVVNSGINQAVILPGTGNGLFAPPAFSNTFVVGSNPVSVIASDIDQDGSPDFLVLNQGSDDLYYFHSQGNGSFDLPVILPVSGGPVHMVATNLNADAFPDLAVVNSTANNVDIFTNVAGTLTYSASFGVGTSPSAIGAANILGPFNSGNPCDLAIANFADDTVTIATNSGIGTFGVMAPAEPVGVGPRSIALQDFDGDTNVDMAVACYIDGDVRSYRGLGDGTFTNEIINFIGTDAGPVNLSLGHFDSIFPFPNDNWDLVTANETLSSASILLGAASDHSFSQSTTLDVGSSPSWTVVGDFDGDGLDDVALISRGDAIVVVYHGDGNGLLTRAGVQDTVSFVIERRFHPGLIHPEAPDEGRRDYDVLYDATTGRSGNWYYDELEYTAWNRGTNPILRVEFPTARRSTHPFLWDADFDRMPDGWEVTFGYDPWDINTDDDQYNDGQENPDEDWYADVTIDNVRYVHHEVYQTNGFHPGTGYGYVVPCNPCAGPATAWFSNYEELIGPRRLPAITANDPDDTATHPFLIDSDADGVWDGWEWYVGMDAQNPVDSGVDWEMDGLGNIDEFRSFNTSTNVQSARTVLPEWANKVAPTDPSDGDTDFDQITDGGERALFNQIVGSNGILVVAGDTNLLGIAFEDDYWQFVGGGLNPTTIDTDGDYMPDAWEAVFQQPFDLTGVITGSVDGTSADAFDDPDGDGLLNYQEYMAGSVYSWRPTYHNGAPAWTSGRGLYGYEPFDFFDETQSAGGQWYIGPGGRAPKDWDPHKNVNLVTPFNFQTAYVTLFGLLWPTADPSLSDTDLDGFDDYYEIYHGMNPMYGVVDEYGFLILSLPDPYDPDIRKYPWITGFPILDIDQDELLATEEAIVRNIAVPPPSHHTDPSPHWMTDTSYEESFVNLYYDLGIFFGYPGADWWYWGCDPGILICDLAPSFMFSFELNEGFDTDNDIYPDDAELVHGPVSPGATDPLNSETPIKRRALYLNGDAYARTRHDYSHFVTEFRTFSVEAWVRPTTPAAGRRQVITERSMDIPVSNLLNVDPGVRYNWQIGLNGDGRPFVRYNNGGTDTIFVEALASPAAKLRAGEWAHVAATYGGTTISNGFWQGMLRLYVDGALVAATPSSEIPANGFFGPLSCDDFAVGFSIPSPMVVGASDQNPAGWIGNQIVFVGPLASIPLNPELIYGAPDPTDFFLGHIDELRVWDGTRTQAEIQSLMRTSVKRTQAAGLWNVRPFCISITNAAPAGLRYSYHFDDLPDPDHNPITPDGFEFLTMRPTDYKAVPWWGQSAERSMVYDDYMYVPWIENATFHAPLNPPRDSTIPHDSVTNQYSNTANPYNFAYTHNVDWSFELHPQQPGSAVDQDSHQFPDLLPLRWAVADEDVDMWDGQGIPSLGLADSDGDGLPDWWEERYGLDPLDATGVNGAQGDPDGDGLWNITEFLALGANAYGIAEADRFSPFDYDTDGNTISDADEDPDGDRLSSLEEQNTYSTHPGNPDTDDDGFSDGDEVDANISLLNRRLTDPLRSVAPTYQRSLMLTGTPVRVTDPINIVSTPRFNLKQWTLEMWFQPTASETGDLLIRRLEDGRTNFALRVDANVPSVLFSSAAGVQYRAKALDAIPSGEWTHVAGSWDPENDTLSLYVNGARMKTQAAFVDCAQASRADVLIGQGLNGYIDELRVWGAVRTPQDLAETVRTFGAGIADNYTGNTPFDVLTVGGTVTPQSGLSAIQSLPQNSARHLMVQFNAKPSAADLKTLSDAGVNMVGYVNGLTRAVFATPAQLQSAAVASLLRSAVQVPASAKMAVGVGRESANISKDWVLARFYKDVSASDAVAAATAAGLNVQSAAFVGGEYLVVERDEAKLASFAANQLVGMVMSAPVAVVSGGPVHFCGAHANVGGLPLAPFVTVGEGWDGPGLGSADLKYYFQNSTPDLPVAQQQSIIEDQFAKWSDVAALTFTETLIPGENESIDILFGAGEHGDGFPFDGPGGVLAHAFFPNDINPESIAGDCHFDEDETWQASGGGGGFDLRQVALHEFGHSIGMGHSADPNAIMAPFYQTGIGDPQLTQDDIDGIQSIYGRPIGKLIAWYHFDDNENTNHVTAIDGKLYSYGAEDGLHQIDYDYALTGVVMSAAAFVDMYGDTDGDGIPDVWEIAHGLDPVDETDADSDADNDGLVARTEYQANTDPNNPDTDEDLTSDAFEDSDCDGLSNIIEQDTYRTDAGDPDTDDDGVTDGQEVDPTYFAASDAPGGRRKTNPTLSVSPLLSRSMRVTNGPVYLRDPVERESEWRFDRSAWTIEAWVYPETGSETGSMITRVTEGGQTNFCLRLDGNFPSVLFTTGSRNEYRAVGLAAIPAATWTHLAGVWDRGGNFLHLYVNGVLVRSTESVENCSQGRGKTFLGDSTFTGNIDEVRIWGLARTSTEIADLYRTIYVAPSPSYELTVTPTEDTASLWNALLGEPLPPGVSDLSISVIGGGSGFDPMGVYENFPEIPDSVTPRDGIILSSGAAADAVGPNSVPDVTTALGVPGDPDMTVLGGAQSFDAVGLLVRFRTDATIEGLSFDFLFGSDEFPEFVGSTFNDPFAAVLNLQNITLDQNGNPITVNNNFFQFDNDPHNPNNPASSGKQQVDVNIEYDGLTPLLKTNKKLSPGVHALKFVIADSGDDIYDSAVFLSNLRFKLLGPEGTSVNFEDIIAYYPFDDGENVSWTDCDSKLLTRGAEDYAHQNDWRYAVSGINFDTSRAATLDGDLDQDGIADVWERAHGLDPDNPSDAWDDPDRDGLNNRAEYQANLDPHDFDSNGNGIGDYDDRPTAALTAGEAHDDGDLIPDSWEVLFPGPAPNTGLPGLSPFRYDADLDPDKDGWSNQGEYLGAKGQGFSTDPLDQTSVPKPLTTISYTSGEPYPVTGDVRVEFFTTAAMDQEPVAVATVGLPQLGVVGVTTQLVLGAEQLQVQTTLDTGDGAQLVFSSALGGTSMQPVVLPLSVVITFGGTTITDDGLGSLLLGGVVVGSIDYGTGQWSLNLTAAPPAGTDLVANYSSDSSVGNHLHEGPHWAIAYIDENGNGTLDKDEMAGLCHDLPVAVGWGAAPRFEFTLTRKLNGYVRFSWPWQNENIDTMVYVNSLTTSLNAMRHEVLGPREYLHEHDFWAEGIKGLQQGSYVAKPVTNGITASANWCYFTVRWYGTPAVPVLADPLGETFEFARNELTFAVDGTNTASFDLQVQRTSNSALMVNTNVALQYTIKNHPTFPSVYRYVLHNYHHEWPNGLYKWRVRSKNPGLPNQSAALSAWSAWESFTMGIQSGPSTIASQIFGDTLYFGQVTGGYAGGPLANMPIIVEAHRDGSFGNVPESRHQFKGMTSGTTVPGHQGDYELLGLRNGEYFVVAYIDSNGNRTLDPWESRGFARPDDFSADYNAETVDLTGNGNVRRLGVRVLIRDRDTDDDGLPDAWEYQYFGTLIHDGSYTGGDTDGDDLATEYADGSSPLLNDSDGDGLSDDFERQIGSNPAVANSDDDGDGLPSNLELSWGGSSTTYNPYDPDSNPTGTDLNLSKFDTDGDGVGDLMEIAAGSDPLDPNDANEIYVTKVSVDSAGRPVLEWNYYPNTRSINITCRVMYSADLLTWQALPGSTVVTTGDTAGTSTYTDGATVGPFYKLELTVQP